MAWESRGNKDYYYRKEWIDGKCVSSYVGAGELAELLAQLDRITQAEKGIEAEKQRESREKEAEIDRNLNEIERKTRDLVESFLIERGFYKTSSREWRIKTDG
jgi:thioredoxin-like negative regulator of GroEL